MSERAALTRRPFGIPTEKMGFEVLLSARSAPRLAAAHLGRRDLCWKGRRHMHSPTPQVVAPAAKPRRKSTKRQRAKINRQARENRKKRKGLRAQLSLDPDAVFSFHEWCSLNAFSESVGRRILATGGPKVTRLSARKLGISRRNNLLWQKSRERGEKG
jgi:hypothetical protein